MKVRTLLTPVVTCALLLLGAPAVSAAPSDYNCSAEVIDQTTDQAINHENLEGVIMYAEVIGIGDNKFMPHTQVPYMIRVFDDLPGNMSADEYRDAWVDACGSYYEDLDNFKYRPYVLIVSDQNSDAGIYSNLFTGDEVIDMVSVATGRMRTSIALGNTHAATVMAVSDISSLLAGLKEAPAYQPIDSVNEKRYLQVLKAVGAIAVVILSTWGVVALNRRRSRREESYTSN